jgi:branched-chain amino acid transport system ATP-binding protein
MLEIAELHAYYGKSHVLQGVDLDVGAGEIVALLGRNGVGRSTTCKAIMGLVRAQGSINYRGREIVGLRTDEIAHLGLGYVPEDRQIFPTLTVRQNLELGLKQKERFGRWTWRDMFELLPTCNASTMQLVLSGGEQQMLTICRTLMGDPDLLIVDEPTEGLAPRLVEQVASLLAEVARPSISILLFEQKLTIALDLSRCIYVMGHGRIVFEGTPADFLAAPSVQQQWLEV